MHQGNKKLLQVTTFCCCSIFHLWVQWRVQAALNWFTVSPMGCAEAMKPPDSVDVFLPAGVEARCQTRDRSRASDLNTNPSTGHEQMDIQLKAALRAEGLSVTSREMLMRTVWELQQVKDSSICQDEASLWLTSRLALSSKDRMNKKQVSNLNFALSNANDYFLPKVTLHEQCLQKCRHLKTLIGEGYEG